jgi:hypothetical protein
MCKHQGIIHMILVFGDHVECGSVLAVCWLCMPTRAQVVFMTCDNRIQTKNTDRFEHMYIKEYSPLARDTIIHA